MTRATRMKFLLPLLFLGAHAPIAHAGNAGAAVAIWPVGLRIPLAVVTEPDSGAIVVFLDTRNPSGEVVAQRVDRHGRPVWANPGLTVLTGADAAYIQDAISDGSGGVIVVYLKSGGGSGNDVYLQHVMPNGTLGYAAGGLAACTAAGDQILARLVPAAAGYFYVVWSDPRFSTTYPDLYAQRFTTAGAAQWVANGIQLDFPVDASDGNFSVASDLLGGFLVAWKSPQNTTMRVQRVNSTGAILYGSTGAAFGNGTLVDDPTVAPDGSGGAWMTWNERPSPGTYYYPYAAHMSSTGTATFNARGVLVTNLQSGQFIDLLPCRNATGGAFVYQFSWTSSQYGNELVRQELDTNGNLLRGAGGEAAAQNVTEIHGADVGGAFAIVYSQFLTNSSRKTMRLQRYALNGAGQFAGGGPVIGRDEGEFILFSSSPAGGATGLTAVAFVDSRYNNPQNAANLQLFGQAVDASGNPIWDDAEAPVILAAPDFPNDQGGTVRPAWNASCADQPGSAVVTGYHVWRALPGMLAARVTQTRLGRAPAPADVPFTLDRRVYLEHAEQTWESVGTSPAGLLPSYALSVPTGQDSVAGASADESFMIEAYDDSSHHWFGGVVTGHSVDNLAPPAPPGASGFYSSGATTLYWGADAAPDLCCYDVYRGGSAGFVPSPANRIGTTTDQLFIDHTPGGFWFRIAARDIHGNIGPSALVMPSGTTDAGPATGPRQWALRASWNRPARELVLALDVPIADAGRFEVFDVAGRRLWSAPFHTNGPAALTRSADPGVTPRSGLVLARVHTDSGRVLLARAVIVR